jgi:hypothetical protein
LKHLVLSRCRPGRHHQHAAVCDGCDKVGFIISLLLRISDVHEPPNC